MTFYDRDDELAALETAFNSPGHDFYVVYGRRRVGKTELLKEFCTDRPHIYYLAAQEAEHRQREKFGQLPHPTSLTLTGSLVEGGACP
ncbi:ATPase [Natronorubrum bangense JCM 10635]|uniref:ATPase n=1 Tax=Natronorubrum bangense JCM 10635 TaxID=1227500 RepID=L9W8N6_9EURY|nr:ATPase [Natronorubrum bangense JCM 10635]